MNLSESVSLRSQPRYGTEPVVDGKYELSIAIMRGDRQNEECTDYCSNSVADLSRQSVVGQHGS